MHIHRFKSRAGCRHTKTLLRESVRKGAKIGKRTLANLTGWHEEQIAVLEDALRVKREYPGTIFEDQANARILEFAKWMKFSSPNGLGRLTAAVLKGQNRRGSDPRIGDLPDPGFRCCPIKSDSWAPEYAQMIEIVRN